MSRKKRKIDNRPKRISKHHLFFPSRNWKSYYAHKLRSHPYCQSKIQQRGIHDFIHRNMQSIPVPNERICKYVLEEIDYAYNCNLIFDFDSLNQKLSFIIRLMNSNNAYLTTNALNKQREIISEY